METIRFIIFIALLHLICSQQTIVAQDTVVTPVPVKKPLKLVPVKATMLSASFPGLGQIYNRKYWKIPLVYAGFGGLGYAVVFNAKLFNRFTKAYQDFTDKDPETASYTDFIKWSEPADYDPVLHPDTYKPANASYIRDQLIHGIDHFKKYRDLSYIGIAVWYLVSIVDANVDASLSDYDIGENLNLTLAPVQLPYSAFTGIGVNLSIKINF